MVCKRLFLLLVLNVSTRCWRTTRTMRASSSFFHVHSDLHEQRHFLCLVLSTCQLKSLFTKKLLIDEIIEGSILLKKLFVIQKIHSWENSFKKVSSSKLLHRITQTLLLFVSTHILHLFYHICTPSGDLAFACAS